MGKIDMRLLKRNPNMKTFFEDILQGTDTSISYHLDVERYNFLQMSILNNCGETVKMCRVFPYKIEVLSFRKSGYNYFIVPTTDAKKYEDAYIRLMTACYGSSWFVDYKDNTETRQK
ncbi:MAG: hypothetical protein E7378_01980 [Clostridiales bacterium]|nr:hypothetical protein [Clostridiales bacterium]